MTITVCIGSSCHIKGSRFVLEELQAQIGKHQLEEKIHMTGAFCLGQCQKGVCVQVDGELFSVAPDTAADFFEHSVLPRLM